MKDSDEFYISQYVTNSVFTFLRLKNLNLMKNRASVIVGILILSKFGPKFLHSVRNHWDFQNKSKDFLSFCCQFHFKTLEELLFFCEIEEFWTLRFDAFLKTMWLSSKIANPPNNRRVVNSFKNQFPDFHRVSMFYNSFRRFCLK